MNRAKVVKIGPDCIEFENNVKLYSEHDQDCCEHHYLYFEDLSLKDFEGLEFDLTGDGFFERIEDYGIILKPLAGHPVSVPGYGYNNGYYSSELTLVITDGKAFNKTFDITECQDTTD